MREFFDLANNPLFVKHFRSRLRRGSLLPAIILVLIVCFIIVGVDWNIRDNQQMRGGGGQMGNPSDANFGSHAFFWLQMFILTIVGGSQITMSLAQVRDTGVIDYHRMTPVPPSVQTIGFLIGAPIREYILFVITIPFAIYCALAGDVGIVGFSKLFVVQIGAVLMSHSLALITGLSAKSSRGASAFFLGIVGGLNLFSANALYPAGIYGPTLLTTVPIYNEVLVEPDRQQRVKRWQAQQAQFNQPMVVQPGQPLNKQQLQQLQQQQLQRQQQAQFVPRNLRENPPVTFFDQEIPVVVQSLLFQGTFVVFLFFAAARRIHSDRIPLWSKPQAMIFFSIVSVLTLGSLWGFSQEGVVMGSLYVLTFAALVLITLLTPSQSDVLKGIRRAERLQGGHIPFWHDLTSMKWLILGFSVIVVTPSIIELVAGQRGRAKVNNFTPVPAIIVAGLAVLSYGFARQALPVRLGKKWPTMFALYILLGWGFPIAFGGVAKGVGVEEGSYLLAVSPLLGMAASAQVILTDTDPLLVALISTIPHAVAALMFFAILHIGLKRLQDVVHSEHGRRDPPTDELEVVE